ncbi:hypothetical protein [Streptomyces lunalinharesii]|uniref:Uncharacterized protein n=1 Tax=Streptomyces lunalinharesii TaxID=333384 RepID=A0ABP6FJM5_9ACTN
MSTAGTPAITAPDCWGARGPLEGLQSLLRRKPGQWNRRLGTGGEKTAEAFSGGTAPGR